MTKKLPPFEKLLTATHGLLQALLKRETVRLQYQAKMARRTVAYRQQRDTKEREEAKKLERDAK
jgi:hypothetical protein